MIFESLWPLAFLLAVPVVVILYLLVPKGTDTPVSSNLLWKKLFYNEQSKTFWEKFLHNLLMYLQIVILLLLIAAEIVYQCCVSFWGKGRRFRFFHHYIAVVGRVLCGWLCGCSLCIGRDRKTAHKDKGGTKGSHGLFEFIFHLHCPPVLRSLPLR